MNAIVSSFVSIALVATLVPAPAQAAAVRRDIKGVELGSSVDKLKAKFDGQCAPDPDPAAANAVVCGKKIALYYDEFKIGLTSGGLADRIQYTFCSTAQFAEVAQGVMTAYKAEKPEMDDFNATVDLDPATKLELRSIGPCTEDNVRRYNLIIVGRDLIDADAEQRRKQQSDVDQPPNF